MNSLKICARNNWLNLCCMIPTKLFEHRKIYFLIEQSRRYFCITREKSEKQFPTVFLIKYASNLRTYLTLKFSCWKTLLHLQCERKFFAFYWLKWNSFWGCLLDKVNAHTNSIKKKLHEKLLTAQTTEENFLPSHLLLRQRKARKIKIKSETFQLIFN